MEQQEQNKVYWVAGNTQTLLIPLEQEVIGVDNEIVAEPYYPAEGSTVTVNLVGKYSKKSYTPQIDGNLLLVTDNGIIGAGAYDVEVLVENPDGTRHRSLWTSQVVVTKQNDSVLQEWDEFKLLDVKARAALFFFVKGDKGEKGDRGEKGEQGEQGIQGNKGDTGNGIASVVLNADYTLTVTFTDGTSYTTPSIRGEKGEKGDKGDKGDKGTTDYKDLENKPDLSIYMQEITQEEYNEIFN
jgi:hypothetical protein